jgi:UDP-N-acetylglucosamine 2-epimerase (non-hydrolysing)
MSDAFFIDLGIPVPHHNLGVGSCSHAQQTALIMQRFEPICVDTDPDVVLVYGDVNSTVAAALVAAKLGVNVGHVEAGLRSRDWSMPEEVNRVVTDRVSNILFTPSRDASANLLREGIAGERIHFVGNVMIDSLVYALPRAKVLKVGESLGVGPAGYGVVTLHRPSNVDHSQTLLELLETLRELAEDLPVIFPVHPRTRDRISDVAFSVNGANLKMIQPLGYLEMLSLVRSAALVITDSGGLQEETSFLGVPCITVRPNTERPITCTNGTNSLVDPTRDSILGAVRRKLENGVTQSNSIELWDGVASARIVDVLVNDSNTATGCG